MSEIAFYAKEPHPVVKAYRILMVLPVVAASKFLTNFWPAYRVTGITVWSHRHRSVERMSFGDSSRLLAVELP